MRNNHAKVGIHPTIWCKNWGWGRLGHWDHENCRFLQSLAPVNSYKHIIKQTNLNKIIDLSQM